MIDYFSIALTHGLILLAAWRLMLRDDLDADGAADGSQRRPWLKSRESAEDV